MVRKIKTKGRKWTVKKVDRGPTYCVALHRVANVRDKTIDALVEQFDISRELGEAAVKTTPIVVAGELSQQEAISLVKSLKSAGDFRVWLSSAATRMKQMNFKIRETEPVIR